MGNTAGELTPAAHHKFPVFTPGFSSSTRTGLVRDFRSLGEVGRLYEIWDGLVSHVPETRAGAESAGDAVNERGQPLAAPTFPTCMSPPVLDPVSHLVGQSMTKNPSITSPFSQFAKVTNNLGWDSSSPGSIEIGPCGNSAKSDKL